MVQGFISIFTDLSWFILLALAISLFCLAVEIFVPSFGFSGILGAILGALGIGLAINEMVENNQDYLWVVADIFIIFLVVLSVIKIIAIVILKNKKKRKVNYIVIDGNNVPTDDMGNPNFSFLIGKVGECKTDLNPSGKIVIDGGIYNVFSEKGYLYKGNHVVVTRTVSSSIYVKKVKSK